MLDRLEKHEYLRSHHQHLPFLCAVGAGRQRAGIGTVVFLWIISRANQLVWGLKNIDTFGLKHIECGNNAVEIIESVI